MKINFSISKLLDNDLFVKIISVVIAIVAWFVIVIAVKPDSSAEVRNVPVTFDLTGTTPESYGLSLIEGEGQTVNIKVDGKKYVIGNLEAKDLVVSPIMTTVTKPGEYRLSLDVKKANLSNNDYNITSDLSNITVSATFDFLREETFPIVAVADNIVAQDGFVKETMLVSPDKITVKGPESELSKIKKVTAENDTQKVVDDTIILDGKLAFYDEANNKLQLKNVTYTDQQYEMSVQVYKHNIVPVEVAFVNIPTGLDSEKLLYTTSEDFIEIAGPKDIIDNIAFINLGEIDFRKINIGSTFEMEVTLPAGAVNVNNVNHITVTIDSTDFDKKTLSISNFSKKNEPAGYQIKLDTKAINDVKIVGNADDIETLSSNDLIAVVDLQGIDFSNGKSRVPVQIYCSGNKFVWAIGEYNVIVSAKAK